MTTCKSTRQDLLLESISILRVAHVYKAALELILHDTSFAIILPAYISVRAWLSNNILHNLC